MFQRILGASLPALLVFGAVGLFASSARAGAFTAPQCANQADIVNYYGVTSDYSGLGLSTSQCKSLCKKDGSQCKSFVNQAKSCNFKSINAQTKTAQKAICSTLSGSEKKSCKQAFKEDGQADKDDVKSDTSTAKSICDEIKDSCVADCEAPIE